MGIGPKMRCPGDKVCVLFGGRSPFVFRPIHGDYIFIGIENNQKTADSDSGFDDDDKQVSKWVPILAG